MWGVIDGLQTSVTGDILKFKRLAVCARNVGGDVAIGEGSISLRAVGVEYNKAVTMVVKMKDKRGKPKGRVELTLQVDPTVKASREKKSPVVRATSTSCTRPHCTLSPSLSILCFIIVKSKLHLPCQIIHLLTSTSPFYPLSSHPHLHTIRPTLPQQTPRRSLLTVP